MGALINEDRFGMVSIALTPVSVAANTSAEQTFTVPGLLPGDFVSPMKPTSQAGLSLGGARVSAPATLALTYDNNTASPIVPTAETYLVFVYRPEKVTSGRFNVG
jgi:hypothetical protein